MTIWCDLDLEADIKKLSQRLAELLIQVRIYKSDSYFLLLFYFLDFQ